MKDQEIDDFFNSGLDGHVEPISPSDWDSFRTAFYTPKKAFWARWRIFAIFLTGAAAVLAYVLLPLDHYTPREENPATANLSQRVQNLTSEPAKVESALTDNVQEKMLPEKLATTDENGDTAGNASYSSDAKKPGAVGVEGAIEDMQAADMGTGGQNNLRSQGRKQSAEQKAFSVGRAAESTARTGKTYNLGAEGTKPLAGGTNTSPNSAGHNSMMRPEARSQNDQTATRDNQSQLGKTLQRGPTAAPLAMAEPKRSAQLDESEAEGYVILRSTLDRIPILIPSPAPLEMALLPVTSEPDYLPNNLSRFGAGLFIGFELNSVLANSYNIGLMGVYELPHWKFGLGLGYKYIEGVSLDQTLSDVTYGFDDYQRSRNVETTTIEMLHIPITIGYTFGDLNEVFAGFDAYLILRSTQNLSPIAENGATSTENFRGHYLDLTPNRLVPSYRLGYSRYLSERLKLALGATYATQSWPQANTEPIGAFIQLNLTVK